MKLMILRHVESVKNIIKSFSSVRDEFSLTEEGINVGKKLAKAIKIYMQKYNLHCSAIHIANSVRARETAKLINQEITCPQIIEWDDLRSTKSGVLLGKTETEAKTINPIFIEQLKLFRCGLFSSYNFEKIHEKEDKKDFERRVITCLTTILNDETDSFKIIIVHHSTLTAIMIHFARLYYNYPNDFYGKVDCDVGNFYLLDINKNSGVIELSNASYSELMNYVIE